MFCETAMNAPLRPFDDIRALLLQMSGPDESAVAAAREREAQLTKPAGSLGRLEDISAFLAGWQGSAKPHVDNPLVAVFAGNHGVVAQGVSPFPASVTSAMVANFTAGGAAINQICKTFDISLKVYELALEKPTGDITREPAMDERNCAGTVAFGMEALASEPDLLVLGEMGIGNTTSAAAIFHALYGGEPEDWVGRGTGVDDEGLKRKAEAVRAAVALHKAHLNDPLEVLARLGGREIAAMAGAILAARLRRTPVVLDGFVVCSAAAVLHALDRTALDHCLAGHVSAERAHREALNRIGKTPILDLGMRLGEGSGAAVAVGVIKAAVACHNGMATFAEAGVAGKE
jgi:nicotinate-nucleotide--dimethylbenzimidazole phosphoribosyltransferase